MISAVSLLAQPQYELSIDNNWFNLIVNHYETHNYARFAVDLNIQNSSIIITLNDTAQQRSKSKCNIEMEFDIYQIPQGNYTLYLYQDDWYANSNRENKKLLYKKDIKISSNYAKSPLSFNFRNSMCNQSADNQNGKRLEVFPNPGSSVISLKFDLKSKSDVNFKILNFLGKEVLNYDKKGMSQGTQLISLEAENLPPGMYIGKLTASNGQVYSVKILWSKQ